MRRHPPLLRPALALLLAAGVTVASPRDARAQAEVVCTTVACLVGASTCLVPEIAGPISPFAVVGLPFEQRRGGMRLAGGLFHHAPLGLELQFDMLVNLGASTPVVQGSALGRWTFFREAFGKSWPLAWEPSQVPDEGGLQGVVKFGAAGRIGDRGTTPRFLAHVGLALEWVALAPMGLSFAVGALVPVGAGMLLPSETPIPYFSIDLITLMAAAASLDMGGCATTPAKRPTPGRVGPSRRGSCADDDCLGPGCTGCGSCGGPGGSPPARRPVINQ